MSKYDKDKIILVRLKFSNICVIENQLRNGKSRNALNKRLRLYEDYLISLLQPVVIDVSGNYFMSSKSDNMMSFEPLFYDDVRIKLNSAVKRIRKDTYFSAPEIRLQLMRVIKYYDNMTARAYQPELLDRNYVSDRMAELTSKQFVAENFEYFVYLRENEIRTYDDAKILLSAKAGAERLISAIKAAECIDGDLGDCSYDDIRIVFDENFLMKNNYPVNFLRFTNILFPITANIFSLSEMTAICLQTTKHSTNLYWLTSGAAVFPVNLLTVIPQVSMSISTFSSSRFCLQTSLKYL